VADQAGVAGHEAAKSEPPQRTDSPSDPTLAITQGHRALSQLDSGPLQKPRPSADYARLTSARIAFVGGRADKPDICSPQLDQAYAQNDRLTLG
jgi:hypothetical protein